MQTTGSAAVDLAGVTVWRSEHGVRRTLLDDIDWCVRHAEHWGVVGPNGAGKSTLLRVLSAQTTPSRGRATILGGTLGKVNMPELRTRIGVVEPALGRRFYPGRRVVEVVATGSTGTTALTDATPQTLERAAELLAVVGAEGLTERIFVTCSEGERARALLARSLMTDAQLLVLDEPAAGLDVGGRELLLAAIDEVARERPGLTTVTVTHHVEELPATTSHLLLLRSGAVVAAGPIDEVATDAAFGACFGLPLRVERIGHRLFVRA